MPRSSLPGRSSDAGPTNRRCECGSITYDSRRDCAVCESPVCSDCPGVADAGKVGLVCAGCLEVFLGAHDVRIDEIDALAGGLAVIGLDSMAAQLAAAVEAYAYPD